MDSTSVVDDTDASATGSADAAEALVAVADSVASVEAAVTETSATVDSVAGVAAETSATDSVTGTGAATTAAAAVTAGVMFGAVIGPSVGICSATHADKPPSKLCTNDCVFHWDPATSFCAAAAPRFPLKHVVTMTDGTVGSACNAALTCVSNESLSIIVPVEASLLT